ncbi:MULTISPECIES: class I SAM-dependent methyltransferase [unclassified Chamaesiphon]|uniref:class I SAM-dependent methyltransferase n=1 Tax=unclassified Chamaesiphon TaxID=2620921 RepID=UPI00286BFBF3|nr:MULTISPECIES: class I SAM-dependent methyltransferase [unclassified Chamaesiphon]
MKIVDKDLEIIESWHKNAAPWIIAIEERQIESRKLVTDRAIIDAVVSQNGRKVLDLGCGEGWLARELTLLGMDVLGTDIIPAFIDRARLNGSQRFELLSYEEIAGGKLAEKFDVVVANFSLLGQQSVTSLFRSIRSLLNPQGSFIVQTLHPLLVCGNFTYVDSWRSTSWDGFSSGFTPTPWYFRTMETWVQLYATNGLSIVEIREPILPQTGKPAAAIFIGISER